MIQPVMEEHCDGCGKCMIYCAHEILQFDRARKKVTLVHPEDCDSCYRCMRHCPKKALLVTPASPMAYRVEPVGGWMPLAPSAVGPASAMPDKVDVLVVGSGAAGLVAAISARESGASVLVVDKAPNIRRTNTSRSGGNIHHRQERYLDPEAKELAVEERVQEALALTGGHVSPELIRAYAEHIDEDLRWLTQLGMRWKRETARHHAAVQMTPEGDGPGLNKQLLRFAQRAGATVGFSTKVLGLLTDRAGAVTGVRVMSLQGAKEVAASAVVLAAGGFQANEEMLTRYLGADLAHSRRLVGSPYSTGDGHRLAEAVGANLVNMDQFHCSQADKNWVPGTAGRPGINQLMPLNNYGIFVNRLGCRFVDESMAGDSVACSIWAQPDHEAALILDESIRAMDPPKVDGYIPPGTVIRANTLAELALAIGCPYLELERTLKEFNAAVKDGTTPGLDVPRTRSAVRLETPPYYFVYPVWATLNCTMGGSLITSKAEVVDLEHRPIPGLYAAGEMIGGFYFGQYRRTNGGAVCYTGNYLQTTASLATCLVFGRIAGKQAADRVNRVAAASSTQAEGANTP